MKKVLIVFLTLTFTGIIPTSCYLLCPCGCGDKTGGNTFDIIAFELVTNNSSYIEIDTSKTYEYTDIFKTLNITDRRVISFTSDSPTSLFITGAMACSPAPLKAIQSFKEIKIISQSELKLTGENDLILKGQNITDRFVMAHEYESDFQRVENFITQNSAIYDYDSHRIRLEVKPFKEVKVKFTMSLLMTDGKTFNFVDQVMNVK
ncbi:MAG: hypothetical protein JJE09_06925 [Bacteroidia bacterium]|nr:hypothetical protein [Bacteroidia bacterium]